MMTGRELAFFGLYARLLSSKLAYIIIRYCLTVVLLPKLQHHQWP
jgi:hypothetical protein